VQAAFAQRRKTLRNNLKGLTTEDTLAALGIDPGARAETLELPDFIRLANALYDTGHGDGKADERGGGNGDK